ncbi:acetylglutamate kinase : Acetylglutamate kinase OS=Planctomyces maris DSM 8797 GN=argB PE=3 SV=1: AA_kinase [Gemmataceae bacterium]|nr:acetylglutamate kinase : Acetylglutamate kinase OS=Planctomyces maris DSM 8797 GN=argB PE=3 SV=1: AA_kinase [Gemmataceae bacterium]VTT98608.1 acetylglutamate kinase : Acetylglutamate kinase OS=Planctomyces maris DSM 8797 GN=argB PE=3 SV=1: AA_kinase [Gemmataceae bacterium]
MPGPSVSAEAFAAAVERVAAHRNKTVVVKLGGSAMEDPAATDACLKSVAVLNRLGVPLVLVHGGGKPIDRAMAEAGLTPKKVAGRRYTDDATLEIVVRVLKDEINKGLVETLVRQDTNALAVSSLLSGSRLTLSGPDGQSIDLGRVGRITGVDGRHLHSLFNQAFLPVVPSLALDADGGWLNVNADTAASAVAGALKADKAIFLTDTPGVLRDRADPASLIPKLTEAQCRELIAAGVIDGGMVPKVEACFEALAAGANSALILDGRVPYSLLDVFLHDTFTGTEITR